MDHNKNTSANELISRAEIILLSGVCRTKIARIANSKHLGFPRPVNAAAHNCLMYNREQVLAWLRENDMQKITIRDSGGKYTPSTLDHQLAQNFLFKKTRS